MQNQNPPFNLKQTNTAVVKNTTTNFSGSIFKFNSIHLNKLVLISFFVLMFGMLFLNTTAQTVTPFTASSTWLCPTGVTSVAVECWGAGGSGGGITSSITYGGGGGGGAYTVNNTVAVVPGTTYTITVGVGAAGSNGSGTAGGSSSFGTTLVVANGGAGGTSVIAGAGVGGAGGTGGTYNGGNGASGVLGSTVLLSTSGGGGGGAGSTGAGGNASGITAGAAGGTDGGIGGVGRGSAGSGAGNPGATYGGGGSGAKVGAAATRAGGKGADGYVRLTYTVPSPFILRPFTQRFNNPSVKGNIVYVSNSIISSAGVGAGVPGTGEIAPGGSTSNGAAGININIDNSNTIIPFATSWKYRDNNTRPVGWETTGFADAAWASGTNTATTDFGYGDGDEAVCVAYGGGYGTCPVAPACNPSPPACNLKFVTTLFRKQFTVTGLSSYTGFQLNMHRDDGAVIYVNGIEVARSNMPTGAITNATLALAATDGADEDVLININTAAFVEGANTIAVEIHQATVASSDISFRLEMNGVNPQANFNSSSSDLTTAAVPTCSRVIFAGLYWGAGEGSGTGSTAWIKKQDTCKLKIPGSSTYTTITSTQTDYWNPTLVPGYAHTGFKCYANITSLINPTNAYGTYTVANVASPAGIGDAYGGWTIVIAYENNVLFPRNITVYDGMAVVKSGSGNVDVPLGGFLTPPSGSVSCELGSIVFDGDRTSKDGYAFKQTGAAAFYDLTPTAGNPTSNIDDMFNSVIAHKGVVNTTRNPAFQNTLGYDANIIEVPNAGNAQLSNSQTGALVRIFSPNENFIVHALTTSITQFTPTFAFDKTGTDISGGSLTTGDSVRYRMNYENKGNDTSTNSIITDIMPIGTSYINNTLKINGVAKTDAVGDDEAEYDFVNNRVVFRIGIGANGTTGGKIPNTGTSASGNVSFDAIIVSTCAGSACVGSLKNVAKISYKGLLSGISTTDSSSVLASGCLINMPVTMAFSGACFNSKDTLVMNPCPVAYVMLPYRRYAGYRFYGAKPFIDANLINPYIPVPSTHTYWAYFTNQAGCDDTIRIKAFVINCNDIDDDNDGIPDYVEFNNNAAMQDLNGDGIPNWNDNTYPGYVNNNFDAVNDNFDWAADSDNDGNPNFYDTDFPGYVDTNGDNMNDNADKDLDGIPNQFDLDSDNDGIPDVVESYGVDANGDGKIDNYVDTDGDGFSQNVDANTTGADRSGNGLGNIDFDLDGIPNYLDLDSDNDGIPDIIEAGGLDANNNGKIDVFTDIEADGFSDNVDGDAIGDNDGIIDNLANALLITGADISPIDGRADSYPNKNFDQDVRPNAYDVDSDMDGILDITESGFADVVAPIGVVDGIIGTNGWSASISSMASLVLRNTDASGNPDYLDIDADDDGIPDNIEGQSTIAYLLPVVLDSDFDGLANTYDNVVGYGGVGIGFYDFDLDGTPDYRDSDADADAIADRIEGNDFNLNGLPDDLVTLLGIDTDGDGLDNRYDSLNSVTNIKGTSYRMGNAGIFTGDATPGSRTTVQRTVITQSDRDWRYVTACNVADTNFATTPQTGSINWNNLAWSRGHIPTCCESVHITYTGTNAGIDAVTVDITNDICIRNLTLVNSASSATNKIFRTILYAGFNMQMNGNVRMIANGALVTDSCIFIANGNNNIVVEKNTTIGYPADNAYSILGSSPSAIGNINYILKGDSLTFNARGLTSSKFFNVRMIPSTDSAYLTNNSNASPFPEAVKFESLRLGDNIKATTFLVRGTNQNNFINNRGGGLEVKTNSTLILASNYTINNNGTTAATLNLNTNATLKVGGNAGGEAGSNFPKNFTVFSLDANSTVDYYGPSSITQTVYGGAPYGKLILSKEVGTFRAAKNTTATVTAATSITVNPLVDLTLGGGVVSVGPFNVLNTAGIYCNANVVSGAGVFTLGDNCYFGSGHAQGIHPLGVAQGSIQMTGGRTFTTTSNYLYNGIVPQITGPGLPSIAVNDLTIDNPTTVTIANNQLVNGVHLLKQGVFNIQTNKIIINGVGIMNATAGKMKADFGVVEMKGNTGVAQNLSGNWFVNKTINILTNANTKGILVAPVPADTLLISEALDYNAVTGSTITTNDNLTLLSRLSKTANFGNATGNSIVGKVNVERYIFARSAWRLLATPIQIGTSPTVSQAWRESNAAHTATGYGTRITGPTGPFGAAGILDDFSVRPSMKSYNSAINDYVGVVNANTTPIANTKGYYVFVRGDRGAAAILGLSGITNMRIKGDLRTGNQVFPVIANKFESIGNPFASRIDMRNVTKTNVANTFYVWNPNNTGLYNVGGYEAYLYNASSTNYERVGDGFVRNYIESGEAFFVQSNVTTAGSLTIKETDKGNGSANVSRLGVNVPTLDITLYAQNADSSMYITDGIKMNFDNNYSNAIDNDDVRKIGNSYDNIGLKNGATNLIVERRGNLQASDTLKFNMTGMRVANYKLDVDPSVLNYPGLEAIFVDKFLQTRTAISFTDVTSIDFKTTTDAASRAADRFMIVFKATASVVFKNIAAVRNADKIVTVKWNVDNEVNVEKYEIEYSTDGVNFNMIATETSMLNNGGTATYGKINNNASIEKNWYRIKANNAFGSPVYSAIALVNDAEKIKTNSNASIAIVSNVVSDGQVKVIFSNQQKGKYSLIITNALGQVIKQSQLLIDNEFFTNNVKTGLLAQGNYQLTVINTIGEKTTMPFIVK